MKYFDSTISRLIELKQRATPDFWDSRWAHNEVGSFDSCSVAPFMALTKRYLDEDSLILEGGCGTGGKVAALESNGFRSIGVDYAPGTVSRLKRALPQLDIREGNLLSLDFADGYFDGYWSFGVIEHFWGGYHPILREAHRVLRDDGYLFLTFPCMSPFRKVKAALGLYPRWIGAEREPECFYQFMLPIEVVVTDLEKFGFQVVESTVLQAASGAKQDVAPLWWLCELIAKLAKSRNALQTPFMEKVLGGIFGHISMIAARLRK